MITELTDAELEVLVRCRDLLGPWGCRVVDREVKRRLLARPWECGSCSYETWDEATLYRHLVAAHGFKAGSDRWLAARMASLGVEAAP